MTPVFIGVDLRQPLAFNVAQWSIHATAKGPVSVTPLIASQLPPVRGPKDLTDFTRSRYLVPWLCGFKGRALFMDADMVVMDDINELLGIEMQHPIHVVQEQPKFEWPSLMLFDCAACEHLTPESVKEGAGITMTTVGELPPAWNVMVKASDPNSVSAHQLAEAKLLHYTEGIPCFPETQHTPGAAHWHHAKRTMLHTVAWRDLMIKSIHARPVIERMFSEYQKAALE